MVTGIPYYLFEVLGYKYIVIDERKKQYVNESDKADIWFDFYYHNNIYVREITYLQKIDYDILEDIFQYSYRGNYEFKECLNNAIINNNVKYIVRSYDLNLNEISPSLESLLCCVSMLDKGEHKVITNLNGYQPYFVIKNIVNTRANNRYKIIENFRFSNVNENLLINNYNINIYPIYDYLHDITYRDVNYNILIKNDISKQINNIIIDGNLWNYENVYYLVLKKENIKLFDINNNILYIYDDINMNRDILIPIIKELCIYYQYLNIIYISSQKYEKFILYQLIENYENGNYDNGCRLNKLPCDLKSHVIYLINNIDNYGNDDNKKIVCINENIDKYINYLQKKLVYNKHIRSETVNNISQEDITFKNTFPIEYNDNIVTITGYVSKLSKSYYYGVRYE